MRGSSIVSTRIPQIMPVMSPALGVQPRRSEEVREGRAGDKVPLELGVVESGEPADDGIELVLRRPFFSTFAR